MGRRAWLVLTVVCLIVSGIYLLQPHSTVNEELSKRPALSLESDRLDGPHLAAAQNFEMTKDPALGYPPTSRKLQAYELLKDMQQNRQVSESAIPGVEWIERGSDNVGGRTRTLMFDPNDPDAKKLWAGAIGGGLWVLDDITDPGARWQNVPGIIDNLAISTIDFDPSTPTTFYLGTGLGFTSDIRGEGIWKSTDAGATWNQLESTATSDFHWVQRIQVTDRGTVLAATLNGLWRSNDGGSSWESTMNGRIADIEIAGNGDVYASTGVNSSGGVFRSTDDGVNWSNITPETGGSRVEIALAPSNPSVIYAVADGGSGQRDIQWFKKSVNGGNSWTNVAIPIYLDQTCVPSESFFTRGQAWFDLVLAVHPEDEDVVIAGGIDLHKSTNGGDSWFPISYWTGGDCDEFVHADQHEIQFRPGFPQEAVFGSDGGVDYSRNVGNSDNPDFDRRVRGYNTMLYYAMAMVNEPGSNIMLAGAQDNGTQRYAEPGLNSTRQVAGGDGAFCFIDQNDPNIQISSFVFNVYRLSVNGGKSFRVISSDQGSGRFINPADYDDDQAMLFSAGGDNELKRIQGITTAPQAQETISLSIGGGRISAIKTSPNEPKRLFVGTGSGGVFRIDSTHLTTMVTTILSDEFPGTPGQFVSSIDIGATDDHLLVTFSNYGVSSIYESTDGGTTWESREGNLPDIPVRWGLFNPDQTNEVLIATELGVWSTTEFNAESPVWEPSNSGLASVRTDMLKYRSADKLVGAATHGRGVFTSTIFADNSLADFTADVKVGYVNQPVKFIDASQASNGSFAWDFGDGSNSSDQNPSHSYGTPGTYTVSLSIDEGAVTETKTDFITILPKRSVPYAPADGGDFESNAGDFTSASLLHDINIWEVGTPNGFLSEPSSGTNVWKTGLNTTLNNLGFDHRSALYTPAFDLSDTDKDYTLRFALSAQSRGCFSPTGLYMEFSLDGGKNWQTLGSSRRSIGDENWYNRGDNLVCAVQFDISEDRMAWTASNNSGDFNLPVATKINHLAGNDNVSFRFVATVLGNATGGYGQDGFMIDDFQISATGPQATFEADQTVGFVGGGIQFNYSSVGAESFLWDFGDGNTSTEMNPVHSYEVGGMYAVSLTITTEGNEISDTRENYITILPKRPSPYLLANGGDFETNQGDFVAVNLSGTPFELGESTVEGKSGTASGDFAWVTGLREDLYRDDSRAELITPTFSFAQELSYTLEFKANFNFEDNWDGFIVEYTTDKGQTWIKLNESLEDGWYNQITDPRAVFGPQVPIFSGDTGGEFETFSTDLSFLFPNEAVNFRFLFLTDANTREAGMALDDFQILAETPTPPVADFTASSSGGCSGETITFTSTSSGTINEYLWNFGSNASPSTAAGAGPHEVTYTGSGTSTVTLTVRNQFGEQSEESKLNFVTISEPHTPTFTNENTSDPDEKLLTASEGDSYQWFFRNVAIDGATEQTYLATESGLYTVEVTIAGCTGRSLSVNVVTDIEEDRIFEKTVKLFPNPVQHELQVGISNEVMGIHNIAIYSNNGILVWQQERLKDEFEEVFEFDVTELIRGNYFVQIISPKGTTVKKLIKE